MFYKDLTFSDFSTVKLLLQYRYKYDQYIGMLHDNHYSHAGNVQRLNKEMINTYVVLDELIKQCKFNDEQYTIIRMVQEGYTYQEIADNLGKSKNNNIKNRFDKICRDIVKINLWNWRKVVYTNALELKTKECTSCGDNLPLMIEFYGEHSQSSDGFQTKCRQCDNFRKKGG